MSTDAVTAPAGAGAGVPAAEPRGWQVAFAWLAHPATLAAVAVLVVNDHALKGAYGNWFTGKLSDAVGMVFFPALVALVVAAVVRRAPWRVVVGASIAITGAGFGWVKATEPGASAASAVLSAVAGPSVVLRDPTDLLALPMLAVAWLVARAAARAVVESPARASAARTAVAVAFAVTASAATGAPPSPIAMGFAEADGDLHVYVDNAQYYGSPSIFRLHADGTWSEDDALWQDGDRYRGHEPDELGFTPLDLACVRSEPTTCYRVVAGAVGVDVTTNGGASWQRAWGLTQHEREYLAGVHSVAVERVSTRSLHVREVAGGHEVWLANGRDGLVWRDASGTWERIQYEGLPFYGVEMFVPLPGDGSFERPTPLPWWWVVAPFASAIAMIIAAAGSGHRHRSAWAWVRDVLLAAVVCAPFSVFPAIAIGLQVDVATHNVGITSVEPSMIAVSSLATPIAAIVAVSVARLWSVPNYLWVLGAAAAAWFLAVGITRPLAGGYEFKIGAAVVVGALVGSGTAWLIRRLARPRDVPNIPESPQLFAANSPTPLSEVPPPKPR